MNSGNVLILPISLTYIFSLSYILYIDLINRKFRMQNIRWNWIIEKTNTNIFNKDRSEYSYGFCKFLVFLRFTDINIFLRIFSYLSFDNSSSVINPLFHFFFFNSFKFSCAVFRIFYILFSLLLKFW